MAKIVSDPAGGWNIALDDDSLWSEDGKPRVWMDFSAAQREFAEDNVPKVKASPAEEKKNATPRTQ